MGRYVLFFPPPSRNDGSLDFSLRSENDDFSSDHAFMLTSIYLLSYRTMLQPCGSGRRGRRANVKQRAICWPCKPILPLIGAGSEKLEVFLARQWIPRTAQTQRKLPQRMPPGRIYEKPYSATCMQLSEALLWRCSARQTRGCNSAPRLLWRMWETTGRRRRFRPIWPRGFLNPQSR